MDDKDDIAKQFMRTIASLPGEVQQEAILAVISSAIRQMDLGKMEEVRAEIARDLSSEIPLVAAALNLFDGAIDLRRMGITEQQ